MRQPIIWRTEILLGGLAIAATLALTYILGPVASPILWSIAISALFVPVYDWFRRHIASPTNAALLTVGSMFTLVMLPAMILTLLLMQEFGGLVRDLQSGRINAFSTIERGLENLPGGVKSMLMRLGLSNVEAIKPALQQLVSRNSQWLAGSALEVGQFLLNAMLNVVLMVYLSFFLVRDGRTIAARIGQSLPLGFEHRKFLSNQFVTTATATIKGAVAVAAVQGALGGVTFWMLGFASPLLWGSTMAALSLIPVFGAALIWLPVAIYLALTGDTGKAMILLIVGGLVIASVDNVLRPLLIGKGTGIPDYLVLLTTLGGISLFGFDGLLIGPIVASFFLSIWQTDISSVPKEKEINRSGT